MPKINFENDELVHTTSPKKVYLFCLYIYIYIYKLAQITYKRHLLSIDNLKLVI